MSLRARHTAHREPAFSLTEVVIALGLVSFVLVSILGLFSVGLRSVGDSESRLEAANLASALLNQRLAEPTNDIASFPISAISPSTLPTNAASATPTVLYVGSGGETKASVAAARFRMTSLVWRDTTFSTNSDLVRVRLLLTWPPAATNGQNSYLLMSSFHANS